MAEIKEFQQILEQNQARMNAIRETFNSQISALVKEMANTLQTLTRVEREFQLSDSRMEEQQTMISHNQEQLTQLRESGSALEVKIAALYTEITEHQKQITILKDTLMEKLGQLKNLEANLIQRKTALESQKKLFDEKQKELEHLKANKDLEVAKQKETLNLAKKQILQVKKENPVADYLLSEAHEPPELDILALLIYRKEIPIIEIKRIAKAPPAITTRILKELENKGILELTNSDTARLRISF